MAPNRETLVGSYSNTTEKFCKRPSRLSIDSLQRTISDISLEISKEFTAIDNDHAANPLPPISEVEDAKCECCGMSEECTPEFISRMRDKFSGKLICGLCAEAVKEEMEKNGGKRDEALKEHMDACVKFCRFGRTHPVLYQAEAMREILKKSSNNTRAKSISPRDKGTGPKIGGIARSSSCIPAITGDVGDRKMVIN